MPRNTSPFIYGDFWLDKRRDGRSPETWQIAHYCPRTRCPVYRSTKRRTLEEAKAVLIAYVTERESKGRGQDASDARIIPHFINYIREHGEDVARLDTIKSSARAWIGFLQQDELGTAATVADVDKLMLARFRRWRAGPHSWCVDWGGKVVKHTSNGVSAEAIQRNFEDLRAALNHAEAAGRIVAPKVPNLPANLRSEPRDTVLTMQQLGSIWGYARRDWPVWRELCLTIATGCRPGAAQMFDPCLQWRGNIIDLHHPQRPRTNKRNGIVPVIEPLRPILEGWRQLPHDKVASRKTWWRTARNVLDLPNDITAYAIRHTVLTFLENEGVPRAHIEGAAGHAPRGTTARHYLHYDPRNARKLKAALTKLWRTAWKQADRWSADHLLTTQKRGKPRAVVKLPRKT